MTSCKYFEHIHKMLNISKVAVQHSVYQTKVWLNFFKVMTLSTWLSLEEDCGRA